MVLLLDVGNTHTHLGLAQGSKIRALPELGTDAWVAGTAFAGLKRLLRGKKVAGAVISSVVPAVTPRIRASLKTQWGLPVLELNHRTVRGIGIDYPRRASIGPDRLA